MISDIFISNLQQLSCLAVTYGPTNECHLQFLCSATTRISCQHFHGAVWCLQNLNLFLGPGCSFSSRINYVLFSSRWEWVFALTAVFWSSACRRPEPATSRKQRLRLSPHSFRPLNAMSYVRLMKIVFLKVELQCQSASLNTNPVKGPGYKVIQGPHLHLSMNKEYHIAGTTKHKAMEK